MKRILLLVFAAAALLFAGVAPAQVATDAGKTGVVRGIHLLCTSSVAASVTGTTTETTLATCSVPGGAMGRSGGVQVVAVWSVTNNANSKTAKVVFGGTLYGQQALVSVASGRFTTTIRNRNATNSQVGAAAANGGSGTNASGVITSAIDSTASISITITATLGVSTDTQTLESYEVWLLP